MCTLRYAYLHPLSLHTHTDYLEGVTRSAFPLSMQRVSCRREKQFVWIAVLPSS